MNNTNVTDQFEYCDLKQFSAGYRQIHGYLSLIVSILGSIANVLNISILTTKEMRWPTNLILTGLAIADLMVMLEYIPYAIHVYFDPLSRKKASYFNYSAAVFMFFHALFTQICHFISCCLTLILAIWRYIAVSCVHNVPVWCSTRRTLWAIALTYVLCPIVCFPICLSLMIEDKKSPTYGNGTLIDRKTVNMSTINDTYNSTIYFVNYKEGNVRVISFWVYSVVLKLIPCILLTVISHQLIKALIAAKKRRYNLLSNKGIPMNKLNGKAGGANQRLLENEQQTDRTTKMLLAVLLLFLITEFPQALLGLLSGAIGDKFDEQCYRPLGDLLDIFALTNSAINFILYCSMSSQFRKAFCKLFRRWRVSEGTQSHDKVTTTTVTNV